MKYGFILLFSLSVISNAYASTDCLQRPSCEELGYEQTKIMCACFKKDINEGILPCPFNIKDENTVFCGDLDYANLSDSVTLTDNVDELVAQGYTKVTKSTTIDDFKKLLNTNNAKIVLGEDVAFNSSFWFYGVNVTINGGGHLLKMNGLYDYNGGATFENLRVENFATGVVWGYSIKSRGRATIRNVEIIQNDNKGYCRGIVLESSFNNMTVENVSVSMSCQNAEELYAIWIASSAKIKNVRIDLTGGTDTVLAGIVTHTQPVSIVNVGMIASGGKNVYGVVGLVDGVKTASVGGSGLRPDALYNGQANTETIVAQLGEKGLAAYAATQFYVGDKNGNFGQGKWYLPSIGEWMELYGTDVNKMGSVYSASGAIGNYKKLINNALAVLVSKGVEAETLFNNQHNWSSSLGETPWSFYMEIGSRADYHTYYDQAAVRPFFRCYFDSSSTEMLPEVGDVMYEDKTFGKAEDYDGSKKAVGVVAIVSKDAGDVTIVNLKDLTFSIKDKSGNFNPDSPYGAKQKYTQWVTNDKYMEDISEIENFTEVKFLTTVNPDAPVVTVNGLKKSFTEPCD